ncbi:hypothetical protein CHI08_20465 [Peribacillus simplex]|nr:hypothetical protein CHI08_20465 [Peribacillus simplex]
MKAVQMYLNGEGSNETKGTKSFERYQSVIIIKYRLKKRVLETLDGFIPKKRGIQNHFPFRSHPMHTIYEFNILALNETNMIMF